MEAKTKTCFIHSFSHLKIGFTVLTFYILGLASFAQDTLVKANGNVQLGRFQGFLEKQSSIVFFTSDDKNSKYILVPEREILTLILSDSLVFCFEHLEKKIENTIDFRQEHIESKNIFKTGFGFANNSLNHLANGISIYFEYERFFGQKQRVSFELGTAICFSTSNEISSAFYPVLTAIGTSQKSSYSAYVSKVSINLYWYKGRIMNIHSSLGISQLKGTHTIHTYDNLIFFFNTPGPTYSFPFRDTNFEFEALGFYWFTGKHFGLSAELGISSYGNLRLGMLTRF